MFELYVNDTIFGNTTSVKEIQNLPMPLVAVLSCYLLVVIVVGLFGNLTVIISSMKYKALRIDPATTLIIEVLAMADLSVTVTRYLPSAIALMSDSWPFPDSYCLISGYVLSLTPMFLQMMLTTLLTCYRCFVITMNAARRGNIYLTSVKVALSGIFLVGVIPPAFCILSGGKVMLDWFSLRCSACSSQAEGTSEEYLLVRNILIIICMSLQLIATAIIIIKVKTQNTDRFRNTLLIVLIVTITYLVTFSAGFVTPAFRTPFSNQRDCKEPMWLSIVRPYVIALNTIVNPVVYVIFNKKYQSWLMQLCGVRRRSSTLSYRMRKIRTKPS